MPEEYCLDGISVLLVDDEVDTATLFTLLLEAYRAVVAVAGTVAEGLQKAEEIQPDVVISDIRLPDGSGLDLLERLRHSSLEVVRNIPVVAVTGQVTPFQGQSMKGEMQSAGFQAFLAKPVEADDLVELLAEITSGHPKR